MEVPSQVKMSNLVPREWKWPLAPMMVTGLGLLNWHPCEKVGVGLLWQTAIDVVGLEHEPLGRLQGVGDTRRIRPVLVAGLLGVGEHRPVGPVAALEAFTGAV